MLQDVYGELRKFLGIKARVVTDEDCGLRGLGLHVSRDGGQREAHVREGEILVNDAAPARGAKLDGRGGAQSSAGAHSASILAFRAGRRKPLLSGPMNTQKRNRARARHARIVLVTCPSLTLARKIARAVVQKR